MKKIEYKAMKKTGAAFRLWGARFRRLTLYRTRLWRLLLSCARCWRSLPCRTRLWRSMLGCARFWRSLLCCVWLCAALLAGGCGRRVIEVIGTSQDAAEAAEIPAAEAVQSPASKSEGMADERSGAASEAAALLVYICGAVKRPGVYELPAGARVFQLVEAAGGLLKSADEKALNQARPLADGEQIVVLTAEETAGLARGAGGGQSVGAAAAAGGQPAGMASAGAADVGAADRLININTAEASELMKLKGIGAARAADIIAYREKNGGFQTIEEIMKVSGIKNSLFEGIKDNITVG